MPGLPKPPVKACHSCHCRTTMPSESTHLSEHVVTNDAQTHMCANVLLTNVVWAWEYAMVCMGWLHMAMHGMHTHTHTKKSGPSPALSILSSTSYQRYQKLLVKMICETERTFKFCQRLSDICFFEDQTFSYFMFSLSISRVCKFQLNLKQLLICVYLMVFVISITNLSFAILCPRLDRGAGNFYILRVPNSRMDKVNAHHNESLKAPA